MVTASVFEVPNLQPMGRFCRSAAHLAGELPLLWGGSRVDVCFTGSELRLLLNGDTYFLRLPAVTDVTMGSRQHPGPRCHEEAAEAAAEFLRMIL